MFFQLIYLLSSTTCFFQQGLVRWSMTAVGTQATSCVGDKNGQNKTYLYHTAGLPSSSRNCTARDCCRSRGRILGRPRIRRRTAHASRSCTCQVTHETKHHQELQLAPSASDTVVLSDSRLTLTLTLTVLIKTKQMFPYTVASVEVTVHWLHLFRFLKKPSSITQNSLNHQHIAAFLCCNC